MADRRKQTYKLKRWTLLLTGFSIGLLFLSTLLVIILYETIYNGTEALSNNISDVIAGYVALVMPIIFLATLIRHMSPVMLDEHGIHKTLFGITWRTIEWANIDTVTIFSVMFRKGKYGPVTMEDHYYVIPKSKPPGLAPGSRIIHFTENFVNFFDIIDNINVYVEEYNINVRRRLSRRKGWFKTEYEYAKLKKLL